MAIDDNTLYGLTGAQVKKMVQRRGNTEISEEASVYGDEGTSISLDSNGTSGHLRVGVDIMNDGSEGFLYLNDSYPSINLPSTDMMLQVINDALPVDVSELYNDAGYQSASQVSSAIASAISGITSFSYEIVQTLPASGQTGTIYLIANTGTTPNIYDEYLWVNGNWEKIGTTEADLSQYYTKTEVDTALGAKANSADVYTKTQADTLLNAKQNTLTAGSNVQIVNNTISATDTTYTAGTGISINNNVISATGGETMLVTLTQTTIGQYSDVWVWSSNYTFAQLLANPEAIRIFIDDWCYESEGNIKPTSAQVKSEGQTQYIYLVSDVMGVAKIFELRPPAEIEGQTVNPANFQVSKYVDADRTALLILPTLTLADNATYIPDGTTITLQTLSSDKEMYGIIGSSDCYPHERIINGNFMILPVKRKVGSGASYWAEEECLVMSASRRGTSSVSDSYIYKTFMFNGEYYKMTLTSDSYPNVVYTITKIPGGQTYTAGTGIDITNGVISCTFANGNGVSY